MHALLLIASLWAGTKDARIHFEEAERFYARSLYEDALVEYEQAYQAKPLPGFLFNIGQCYRNLGRFPEAIAAFKKFLALKPDTPKRAAVESLLRELEGQGPKERNDTPPAVKEPPGPGEVTPQTGGSWRSLRPSPGAGENPSVPVPSKRHIETVGAVERDMPAPAEPYYKKWWFWTAVGVVAAGAGVGIYYATHMRTEIENANLPGITYP